MSEYIDREAAIKEIENADYSLIADDAESLKADYLREIIENIPAADVAPVVRGEWLLRRVGAGHYCECSVCHANPCIYVTEHTKFCPNCGAKMEEDGNDGD